MKYIIKFKGIFFIFLFVSLAGCAKEVAPLTTENPTDKTVGSDLIKNKNIRIKSSPKPFEGEWRMCIDHKGKNVCASHLFIQQDDQICGSWQQIDAGVVSRSGFLQATQQPQASAMDKEVMAIAKINYVCGSDTSDGFSTIPCGNNPSNPAWQTMRKGWDLRKDICKNKTTVSITNPFHGYNSICPVSSQPPEMYEYQPLPAAKRNDLMNQPWLLQCLQGKTPEKVADPKY